jgi:uncharacterized protein (TIGR03067 family)
MRSAAFLLLVAAVSAATGTAAPVPKHLMKEGDNTEQSKLQGKWKLESIQLGEMNLGGAAIGIEGYFEFRGDQLTVSMQGQTVTATVKLDTADGLKRLATTNTKKVGADGKPAGKEDDVTFGYVIEEDKLMIAVRADLAGGGKMTGPIDPKKPGPNGVVMVLTRIKAKN